MSAPLERAPPSNERSSSKCKIGKFFYKNHVPNLTLYATMMKDKNIMKITGEFIHQIMTLYEMVAIKYG